MGALVSQSTGVSIVYSTVCSGAYQRKHQSSASLAFVRGIQRWPVNSPHKGTVTRKMFPFHDISVIMRFTWTTHFSPSQATYHEYLGEIYRILFYFFEIYYRLFQSWLFPVIKPPVPEGPSFLRMRYWFGNNTHRSHIGIVRVILTIAGNKRQLLFETLRPRWMNEYSCIFLIQISLIFFLMVLSSYIHVMQISVCTILCDVFSARGYRSKGNSEINMKRNMECKETPSSSNFAPNVLCKVWLHACSLMYNLKKCLWCCFTILFWCVVLR